MLKGKVAVVTGSTSGIGLGIAKALAEAGADIILSGLGPEAEILELEAEIAKKFGVKVSYHAADLSKPEDAKALIKDTIKAQGGIDILINNAGIQHVSPIETFPDDRWTEILAINLSAAFYTIKETLPVMRERNWGRIINIASIHGLVASINKSAYVAAKHGIIGLSKVVALEAAETSITCNTICPGWVRTPLVEKQIIARAEAMAIPVEDAARSIVAEKEPSKRFTSIEDVAQMAVFLCSPAASNITGSNFNIDGGWLAQ